MLPPREMNEECLRCHHALARQDTHCSSCGADRELELAVAGQLVPTIGSLRRWLGGLGVLQLAVSGLSYEHYRRFLLDGELYRLVVPGALSGLAFLALAALASRKPLACAVAASVLFGVEWLGAILVNPSAALMPSLGLALRIVLAFVLVTCVRAGWRAAQLRRQAAAGRKLPVARVEA